MYRYGIVFALAAVAGWGFSMSSRKPDTFAPTPEQAKGSSIEAAASKPKWTREDVLRSAKDRAEKLKAPGYNPYEDIVADWTDEEIRAALEESLKHPDCALARGAAGELPGFLLGLWMKRDLDAALAWVNALEASSMKHKITESLALKWPLDKTAEGVDYLIAHRDLFAGISTPIMLNRAIQQCAMEGAESVKAMLRKMDAAGLVPVRVGQDLVVKKDFDFAALMDSPELAKAWEMGPGREFAMEWFQQDRAAAFDWMLQKHGMKEVFSLVYGEGDLKGDLRWMGGHIETLEPERREEFFESVKLHWSASPFLAKEFAEGMKDPVLQEQTRLSFGAKGTFSEQFSEGVDLLEHVAEPAKRVAALEQLAREEIAAGSVRYGPPDTDNVAFLRGKLEEWQASPEQIELIVNRLQP